MLLTFSSECAEKIGSDNSKIEKKKNSLTICF